MLPAQSRPLRHLAVAIFSSMGFTSCMGSEVASHNLDQLLREDGGFRYSGTLKGEFEYHLSQMVDGPWLKTGLMDEDPEPIDNPTEVTLDHLLVLAESDAGAENPLVAATQVRQFARYSLLCPSDLARERCFLELGQHARRLQVERPQLEFPEPASPEQLADSLAELVRLHRLFVEGQPVGEEPIDLAAAYAHACDACAALPLDMRGGWRLLKLLTVLEANAPSDSPGQVPMRGLSLKLQHHLVSMCLTLGVNDPSPRARAAAWGACHTAYGSPFLAEALVALVMPARDRNGRATRTQRYGLLAQTAADEEVYLTVFDAVRSHGLPKDLPGTDPEQLRMSQLFILVQVAHDFSGYSERARFGAMQTLNAIAGAGARGLRKEEWEAWWEAASASLSDSADSLPTDGQSR